jgi:hypothetical protein
VSTSKNVDPELDLVGKLIIIYVLDVFIPDEKYVAVNSFMNVTKETEVEI